jgi:hypothetical protein
MKIRPTEQVKITTGCGKSERGFNYLNNKYSTLYNLTEYLAVDELIVKFK